MMMNIAQKCNLQLLPLPGMLSPVNASTYIYIYYLFLVAFCCSFNASDINTELTCIFSAIVALFLVQLDFSSPVLLTSCVTAAVVGRNRK